MNSDTKMGFGVVVALALCCGGPLILSALASGAALGALGALWDGASRPLLLGGGAVLLVAGVWLLARRFASQGHVDAASCDANVRSAGVGHGAESAHAASSVGNKTAAVGSTDRTAGD